MSQRGLEWIDFANQVTHHIEEYTVPQYGDKPHDQASQFDVRDIKSNLMRYANRIGSNARGHEEALRDCKKIAHYACLLYAILQQEK